MAVKAKVRGKKNYWKSNFFIIRHPMTGEKLGEWQVNIYDMKEGYEFEPRLEIREPGGAKL